MRSAVFSLLVGLLSPVAAVAQVKVSSGDAGSIRFTVGNYSLSTAPLLGVRVSTSGPAYFSGLATSDLGPVDILPGLSHEFVINYQIGSTSANEAFNVVLNVIPSSQEAMAIPNSRLMSSTVQFTLDTTSPSGTVANALNDSFPGGIIQGDQCAVFRSSDAVSGLCSVELSSGPPGFVPLSVPTQQPELSVAWAAPFCQLSSGTYTLLVRDCVGNQGNYTFTAATKTLQLNLTASGPLGWSDSSSVNVSADQIQSTNWGFRAETQTCSTELTEVCKRMQTSLAGVTAECNFWENCGFLSKVMSTVTFSPPWQSTGYSIANVTVGTSAASAAPPIVIKAGSAAGGGASVTTSTPLASGESITGYITVPQVPKSVWRSTVGPELEVAAPVEDLNIASTTVVPSSMSAAAQHNLLRQSSPGIYEFSAAGATGIFGTTTTITLTYSDSVNSDTATLKLYRWNGSQWRSSDLSNQSVAKSTSGLITVIARSTGTSWYAAFFQATDSSAPVTSWSIDGSSTSFYGIAMFSTSTLLILSSTDPVVNSFNSGVATTYYRIDGPTGGTYSVYSTSINFLPGTHWVDYYSADYAGNIEGVKRITFTVTAGDFTWITDNLTVDGNLLVGDAGTGARAEVVASPEWNYTLLVSSVDASAMMAVDNSNLVAIGTVSSSARLTLAGVGQDTALALRSGNSTAAVSGAQIAFGYNGTGLLRHRIYTQHGSAANFNKMVFALWTPATGSSSTLGGLPALSLEGSTITPANALVHIVPAGIADKELVVSNGSSMGEGDVLRWERWVPSASILKKDIKRLGQADEERAWADVMALKPVFFRRKVNGPDSPLERGFIFEETPASIQDGPGATSIDERVVNAELALKAAIRRIEGLKARIRRLKGKRQ